MGYRSEVVFIVETEAEKELLEMAKDNQEMIDFLASMKNSAVEKWYAMYPDDKVVPQEGLYYANWVKWYPDDPQIAKLMIFFDALEHAGREEEFGFIRLGEDDSDIEILGSPYDIGLGYSRHVTF